jgi:hypothetical protein
MDIADFMSLRPVQGTDPQAWKTFAKNGASRTRIRSAWASVLQIDSKRLHSVTRVSSNIA